MIDPHWESADDRQHTEDLNLFWGHAWVRPAVDWSRVRAVVFDVDGTLYDLRLQSPRDDVIEASRRIYAAIDETK